MILENWNTFNCAVDCWLPIPIRAILKLYNRDFKNKPGPGRDTRMKAVPMKSLFSLLIVLILSINAAGVNDEDDSPVIAGKAVIFFGPSQEEYDVLSGDSASEIDEILFDFYYYVENLIPSLDRAGLDHHSIAHADIILFKACING